ncbi:MAG TPA: hypothetical protein VK489_08245 [Ferruginibacter sp.]|nr:hypothetical protein [Ferruginibacter sp.]
MISIIIWFASFFCPNPGHTTNNHGSCTLIHTTTPTPDSDTGGETGGTPKPPPPPPPPAG